jgi:hypothetical protein
MQRGEDRLSRRQTCIRQRRVGAPPEPSRNSGLSTHRPHACRTRRIGDGGRSVSLIEKRQFAHPRSACGKRWFADARDAGDGPPVSDLQSVRLPIGSETETCLPRAFRVSRPITPETRARSKAGLSDAAGECFAPRCDNEFLEPDVVAVTANRAASGTGLWAAGARRLCSIAAGGR